jgi:hypothetical protein
MLTRTQSSTIGPAKPTRSNRHPTRPGRFYTLDMAMVIELSVQAAARVAAAAAAKGVSETEIVEDLVTALPKAPPARRRLALAGFGATGHGITTHIDADLAEGFGRD